MSMFRPGSFEINKHTRLQILLDLIECTFFKVFTEYNQKASWEMNVQVIFLLVLTLLPPHFVFLRFNPLAPKRIKYDPLTRIAIVGV